MSARAAAIAAVAGWLVLGLLVSGHGAGSSSARGPAAATRPTAAFPRAQYHITPTRYFMNDPNAPFFDATHQRYHLFYGVYPPATLYGGARFWSHCVSDDLVHWQRLPTALAPTSACDMTGCHSGSASIINGTPVLVYTGTMGVRLRPGRRSRSRGWGPQVQCLAFPANVSDPDLAVWVKSPANPVIRRAPSNVSSNDFRDDTTAWQAAPPGGPWLMGVGCAEGGTAGSGAAAPARGSMAIYAAQDATFTKWSPTPAAMVQVDQAQVAHDMWECPDFFPLPGAGGTALALSNRSTDATAGRPWALKISVNGKDHPWRDYVIQGEWRGTGTGTGAPFSNTTAAPQLVDVGTSLYASKSFSDTKATHGAERQGANVGTGPRPGPGTRQEPRRIMFAWVREELPRNSFPVDAPQSVQALPRVVGFDTRFRVLTFAPLPELALLRDPALAVDATRNSTPAAVVVGKDRTLLPSSARGGSACEVVVRIDVAELSRFRALEVDVLRSSDGSVRTTVVINRTATGVAGTWAGGLELAVARGASGLGPTGTAGQHHVPLLLSGPGADTQLDLHIFVDQTVVEVFVQGGRCALTTRVYPTHLVLPGGDDGVDVAAAAAGSASGAAGSAVVMRVTGDEQQTGGTVEIHTASVFPLRSIWTS